MALDDDEKRSLGRDLGTDRKLLLLRNRGTLSCGPIMGETRNELYTPDEAVVRPTDHAAARLNCRRRPRPTLSLGAKEAHRSVSPQAGTSDIMARAFAEKLAAGLEVQVIVDNRAGAGEPAPAMSSGPR
jgi:hypothetical protein